MSRKRKNKKGMIVGLMAVLAVSGALLVMGVGRVQGAKVPPASPIYFSAAFLPTWQDAGGGAVPVKVQNDIPGQPYIHTADAKRTKYGVTVKYTPPSGAIRRGQFVMKLDRAGILGRYVNMQFKDPLMGAYCRPNPEHEDCCKNVRGFMDACEDGIVETSTLTISTQIVLDDASGQLARNVADPFLMGAMTAGQRKIVGLGISFTPDVEGFDYQYDLGSFTDPGSYIPGSPCQGQNYSWGPAELVCLTTGQVWEFRPMTEAYFNEPNNLWRLLMGRYLCNYWVSCRSDKWEMPFVLQVTKI